MDHLMDHMSCICIGGVWLYGCLVYEELFQAVILILHFVFTAAELNTQQYQWETSLCGQNNQFFIKLFSLLSRQETFLVLLDHHVTYFKFYLSLDLTRILSSREQPTDTF